MAIMITTARRPPGQGIGRHRHICAAGRITTGQVQACTDRLTAGPVLVCMAGRHMASLARIPECTGPVDRVLAVCISPVRSTGPRPGRSTGLSTGRSLVVDLVVAPAATPAVTADNHCLT